MEYLIDFIDKLSQPPRDLGKLLKAEKYLMQFKGYGTPELEMKYMHTIFLHIQESHREFQSLSWQQYNGYNDNYYHIKLESFTLNDKLDVYSDISFYFKYYENDEILSDISITHLDSPDPDEIEFANKNNIKIGKYGLVQPHLDTFWEYQKKKYSHLEIPCLKFLTFLKLLEINFSMYYFLYTFGNGVEVKFDKEGVAVKKLDENEIGGSPLGEGMDL